MEPDLPSEDDSLAVEFSKGKTFAGLKSETLEMQSKSAIPRTTSPAVSPISSVVVDAKLSSSRPSAVVLVIALAIILAAGGSHFAATLFGLHTGGAAYRRIGPAQGQQIFCAGSSLLQFGLAWDQVSQAYGRGIENWGVGGSSPSEWEVSQRLSTNSDLLIVGVSAYDLNEHHLCDSRANIVPIGQTIEDLWQSPSDWEFSKRLLSQYPVAALRKIFPTAGKSDAVLVGIRRKLREVVGRAPSAEDQGNSLVLPSEAVLSFGDSTEKMSDWPTDKVLRRLVGLRNENRGRHDFEGPKQRALLRMLDYAGQRGAIVVVVLPVAPRYTQEFLSSEVLDRFEKCVATARRAAPKATFVRLDQAAGLLSDEYYSDLVHLNGAGRRIATQAFLDSVKQQPPRP